MEFLDRMRARARGRRIAEWDSSRRYCSLQGDQSIANQAGAAFRTDLNAELQALVTLSSGTSAPSTSYAHQLWADTTNNLLKKRNAANSAWLVVRTLDESFVLSRSSNTIFGISDVGKTFIFTSSFTQTFTAVATLADGWWVALRNDGTGVITLDPNSSEQIDGATTIVLNPGESCFVFCNGSSLKTAGRASSYIPMQRGELGGLTLSNNATATKLDVAAGKCRDSTDVADIILTSAVTAGLIQTSGSWAAGNTQNKLDTGARANSTWYHVYAIRKDSDGSGDFLFSLSVSAPTMPSGYTYFRRIGSVRTDGSGNITAFVQSGDSFLWAVAVQDVAVSNPGTSAVTRTLTVPTGYKLDAILHASVQGTVTIALGLISSFDASDTTASIGNCNVGANDNGGGSTALVIRTNISGQVRSRLSGSDASTNFYINTEGWHDQRGRTD